MTTLDLAPARPSLAPSALDLLVSACEAALARGVFGTPDVPAQLRAAIASGRDEQALYAKLDAAAAQEIERMEQLAAARAHVTETLARWQDEATTPDAFGVVCGF